MKTKENGKGLAAAYTHEKLQSHSALGTVSIEVALADISSFAGGHAVLWQHHGVFVGKVGVAGVDWIGVEPESGHDTHSIELRLFNAHRELRVWRLEDGWRSRLRVEVSTDAPDAGLTTQACICVDAEVILRPVLGKRLRESEKHVWLKTRNYVGFNDDHVAGYVDSRFVEFLNIGG